MKGFLSILALPAIILPVLAAPSSSLSPVEQDLAILKNMNAEISPITAKLDKQLKLVEAGSAKTPSATTLEAEWKKILTEIQSGTKQLKAVSAANGSQQGLLEARQGDPEEQLEQAVMKLVTMITQEIEKFQPEFAKLPDAINDLALQIIGALVTMGEGMSAVDASAPNAIASVLEQVLGV